MSTNDDKLAAARARRAQRLVDLLRAKDAQTAREMLNADLENEARVQRENEARPLQAPGRDPAYRMPNQGEQAANPDPRRVRCSSCGADIIWGTTTKGSAIPLDPTLIRARASGPGPVVMLFVREGRVRKAFEDPDGAGEGEVIEGWVSHFATCPHAARHRRKE